MGNYNDIGLMEKIAIQFKIKEETLERNKYKTVMLLYSEVG